MMPMAEWAGSSGAGCWAVWLTPPRPGLAVRVETHGERSLPIHGGAERIASPRFHAGVFHVTVPLLPLAQALMLMAQDRKAA